MLTLRGSKGPQLGPGLEELGIIPDGAVLVRDGVIAEVGPTRRVENLAHARDAVEVNASGRVVMPGFVDSHTHVIFPPPGAPEEDAERSVRTVSGKRLQFRTRAYLEAMARHGTTTVQCSTSGIADRNLEIKLLRVLGAFKDGPVAVVPGVTCRPADEAAVESLLTEVLPKVRQRKLARIAEIEWSGAAPLESCRRLMREAGLMDFSCRLHADEQSSEASLRIALETGVAGVHHVEHADAEAVAALGRSGTIVTLLPFAAFRAEGRIAPARALIEAGAAVALATNFNPQHTPALSMQTVVSLACMRMGLTAAEAITASTINGAWALGCADQVGSIEPGKSADILILNVSDYRELADQFGMNLAYLTLKRGARIYEEGEVAPRDREAVPPNWG